MDDLFRKAFSKVGLGRLTAQSAWDECNDEQRRIVSASADGEQCARTVEQVRVELATARLRGKSD